MNKILSTISTSTGPFFLVECHNTSSIDYSNNSYLIGQDMGDRMSMTMIHTKKHYDRGHYLNPECLPARRQTLQANPTNHIHERILPTKVE